MCPARVRTNLYCVCLGPTQGLTQLGVQLDLGIKWRKQTASAVEYLLFAKCTVGQMFRHSLSSPLGGSSLLGGRPNLEAPGEPYKVKLHVQNHYDLLQSRSYLWPPLVSFCRFPIVHPCIGQVISVFLSVH